MDNFLGKKEINAIIKMTKQKKGHGDMTEPTPKQKLIEAVEKRIENLEYVQDEQQTKAAFQYGEGKISGLKECLKLIEGILP